MESTLVIKVKYGDTLRRFNARVNGKELELDITGLRAKILSLFNLSPDADINMTYTDEDGDVVTLSDDDDLSDVMRQCLDFVRIEVQLKDDKGAKNVKSSGSSTPLRSPQVPIPLPFINNDVLKSVSEPLCEALNKLSLNLASKAASTSPVVLEIVDCLAKMGQFYMDSVPQSGHGADSGPQGVVNSDMPSVFPNTNTVGGTSGISQEVDVATVTGSVGAPVLPVDLNLDPPVEDVRGTKEHDGHTRAKQVFGAFGKYDKPVATPWERKSECPFSGMPLGTDVTGFPGAQLPMHPFKRRYNHNALGGIFHKGVQCDGCGMYPITGPRFKSKVKENYDLCSICISKMGNEADYIRMDRPVSYSHHHSHHRPFKGLHETVQNVLSGPLALPPHVLRGCGIKANRPKLDSRFILDVTVMDGTVMAPSTTFTKIWRMRNNGEYVWTRGIQLVWVGGDTLSDLMAVDLEIPIEGVRINAELDIAVDFRAPESPGRYMSYWKMASSTGHKFGQRVWVLIQVDASLKDHPISDTFQGLNLNLPPDNFYSAGPGDLNVPDPVLDHGNSEPHNSNTVVEQPRKEQDLNFPINDALLVSNALDSTSAPNKDSSMSYPIIDFSEATQAGASWVSNGFVSTPPNASPPTDSSISYPIIDLSEAAGPSTVPSPVNNATAPPTTDETNAVEQTLLKELEEMGFKQVDLNKEVLRMNEYNLEQSLDDLCGVAEWDPILEELHEMGFCDTETNKMLLKKNNGSIKRVVMDLITSRGHGSYYQSE